MIFAIDPGTTCTTCLVVDEGLRPIGRGYREIAQHFPEPGWVEHDPEEIWASRSCSRLGTSGRRAPRTSFGDGRPWLREASPPLR